MAASVSYFFINRTGVLGGVLFPTIVPISKVTCFFVLGDHITCSGKTLSWCSCNVSFLPSSSASFSSFSPQLVSLRPPPRRAPSQQQNQHGLIRILSSIQLVLKPQHDDANEHTPTAQHEPKDFPMN